MRFTEITLDQFKTEIGTDWIEFNNITCREYVFDYIINNDPTIVIRIFSSIHKQSNINRDRGYDAIRVCAVDTTNKQGYIKSIKVLRVQGWRHNLLTAISKISSQAHQRIERNNQYKRQQMETINARQLVEANEIPF
jgi:hypothetical protein